jgi:hypothetical protein
MSEKTMKVEEVEAGQIFETVIFGNPTGNLYKATARRRTEPLPQVDCLMRFNQGKKWVALSNNCRVLDPALIEGF